MTRSEILGTAKQFVCEGRDQLYGIPEDNFALIAELWTAYDNANPDNGMTAMDVVAKMILLKVARICTGKGSVDNWIDIAGYAACGGEIER